MKDKIINYIEYLENTHNLSVSLHFADIYKYSLQNAASGLAKYNVHKNPYCFYIKMDKAMHRRCILCQYAVMRKCRKNEFFTGSCHAGVDEYIERIMVMVRLRDMFAQAATGAKASVGLMINI